MNAPAAKQPTVEDCCKQCGSGATCMKKNVCARLGGVLVTTPAMQHYLDLVEAERYALANAAAAEIVPPCSLGDRYDEAVTRFTFRQRIVAGIAAYIKAHRPFAENDDRDFIDWSERLESPK